MVIEELHETVNRHDPEERRTNYRLYLQTLAHYLTDIEKWDEAKQIYDDQSMFTAEERIAAIKEIEIVQSYRSKERA